MRKYDLFDLNTWMDFSDEFVSQFSGKGFASYAEFHAAFEAFQEQTGLQYMFKRTFHFPEGHRHRETLVYKSIHYVCVESKLRHGSCCQSFFTVGCRNGFLYVSKYHMFHNHNIIIRPKPKPESYTVIADYTNQFKEIFPNMTFDSFRQFEEKMEEFQARTGCVYAKRHTCPWPKDDAEHRELVYKKLAYECFHYGYKKEVANGKPYRRTFRTGCRSAVFICCRNNALHITRFEMRHNHPISGASGNVYRSKRRLTYDQQLAVSELLKKHEHEIIIKQFIQAEVRNLKRKLKPKVSSSSRISRFPLKHLKTERQENILFDEIGDGNVISFTAVALSKNFHLYPEVLQIRQFGGPSMWGFDFSVIDKNLRSRTVMYSFALSCESIGNFTPILRSFKKLMRFKWDKIETIFVDAFFLAGSDFTSEFPHANILFYRDSVLSTVNKNLRLPRFSKYNRKAIFDAFVNAVITTDAEDYASSIQTIAHLCPPFFQFLDETFLPCVDQWAEHLRLEKLTFGLTNRSTDDLRRLETLLPTQMDDFAESAKGLLDLTTMPNEVVEEEKVDLRGQPEDILSLLRLLSGPVASILIQHLGESSDSLPETSSDLSTRTCSCSFNFQWRLPCIHLINAARAEYIPLSSLLKDSRWSKQRNLDKSESKNVVECIITEENDEDTPFSSAKRLKINDHLQTLQMVVTSEENNSHQVELKELEGHWLVDDGVISD